MEGRAALRLITKRYRRGKHTKARFCAEVQNLALQSAILCEAEATQIGRAALNRHNRRLFGQVELGDKPLGAAR